MASVESASEERTGLEAVSGSGLGELDRGMFLNMSADEWEFRKLQMRVEGEVVISSLMRERGIFNWMREHQVGLISWEGMDKAMFELDCGYLGDPDVRLEWELDLCKRVEDETGAYRSNMELVEVILGLGEVVREADCSNLGRALVRAGLDIFLVGNVATVGKELVYEVVGCLPGGIEIARTGAKWRDAVREVRRGFYELLRVKFEGDNRQSGMDWVIWARSSLVSQGMVGVLGERIDWAVREFVPVYIEEKRDVEGLGDEGRGWVVRTGYNRSRKSASKVDKDSWCWELKRKQSNDLLRWISAGRFSELGGEVWVVQGEVWEKAGQLVYNRFLECLRNAGVVAVDIEGISRFVMGRGRGGLTRY